MSAETLGNRANKLTNVVLDKVSKLHTQPVFAQEVILGTVAHRLRDIPFEDFDATRAELAKHIKRAGCCEVIVGIERDRVKLSDLLVQMDSAAEVLAPFRKALEATK